MPHHSTLAACLAVVFGLTACGAPPDENEEDGAGGESGSSGTGGGGSSGTGGGGSSGTGGESGSPGTGGGSSSGWCEARTPGLVSGSGDPADPATPLSEIPIEGSACNAVEREFAEEPAIHVVECSEIEYTTNPPCTGMHYPFWPAYRVYDEAIPRGFWVHGLEHGAVTIGYSCTDCPEEVDAAIEVLNDAGLDPLCDPPSSRTILMPDPRLETRWAASSWGYTLTADCFEPGIFLSFVVAHRGRGPEAVCSDGIDVSEPPP